MRGVHAAILCCFAAVLCVSVPAISQTEDSDLGREILVCVVHETSGPWVHAESYDGRFIQFNYAHDGPISKPGHDDYHDANDYVYAAFWNRDRTSGEFLQFIWFRAEAKAHLRIVNNAKIVSSKGRLDLEDALWGTWTYEHLKKRLQRLKDAPAEAVSLAKIEKDDILCDSYSHPISGPLQRKKQEK